MAIEGAAEQAAPSSSVSRPQVHRQREERVLRCLAVQAHTLLVRAAGFCDPSLRAQVDGQTGGGALQPIQPPPDGQSIFCAPVKLREADGHDSCPLLLTCGKRRTSTASLNRLRCIRTAVIASTAAATVRRQRGVSLGRCRFVSGSLLGGRRCERVVSRRTTRLTTTVGSRPLTDVPSGHGAVLPRRRPQARRQPEHSGRRIEVITWSIVSSGLRCWLQRCLH
jgi:hypothetical protein